MSNDPDKQDQRLDGLALLLSEPVAADGSQPDAAELWDFINGIVGEERAAQILQHLAADEDLYDQWRELRAELGSPPGRSMVKERWNRWLTGWPAGAVGYAALFCLVAITVSQVQGPVDDGFWEHWRQPKQTTLATHDSAIQPELLSVLAGIGKELRSLEQEPAGPDGRALPLQTPDCDEADAGCPARRAQLFRLGELLAAGLQRCHGTDTLTVPTDELVVIGSVLEADGRLQTLQAPLQQWLGATTDERVAICSAISTLVDRALAGL